MLLTRGDDIEGIGVTVPDDFRLSGSRIVSSATAVSHDKVGLPLESTERELRDIVHRGRRGKGRVSTSGGDVEDVLDVFEDARGFGHEEIRRTLQVQPGTSTPTARAARAARIRTATASASCGLGILGDQLLGIVINLVDASDQLLIVGRPEIPDPVVVDESDPVRFRKRLERHEGARIQGEGDEVFAAATAFGQSEETDTGVFGHQAHDITQDSFREVVLARGGIAEWSRCRFISRRIQERHLMRHLMRHLGLSTRRAQ